jgi:thiamine-monophosphate kinase
MAEKSSTSGEDDLIARYFKPLATHPGAFGLIDDAAAVAPPPGCDLVLKTDAIIGGVHFFADDPPRTIAQKALRVNLSDLAAKGAAPFGCLLSIGLPSGIPESWLEDFAAGLGHDVEHFKCPLFGGDTVRSPDAVMVSVTVIGAVPHGKMVKRAGAKPGDRVVVTGTIGDAAMGLLLRKDAERARQWGLDKKSVDELIQRYLVPQPRSALAEVLREFATAGMDVSDGMAGDLGKLCRASDVSADIDVGKIPLSAPAQAALKADAAIIGTILTNGDDYEVLATIPASRADDFIGAARQLGIPVADIGMVTAGASEPLFLQDGRALKFARRSYSHF